MRWSHDRRLCDDHRLETMVVCVECAQCAKHLTSKATAFVVKASMVKAWSTWREYRMSHAVSERALTFWVQCLMRKVFERWCQIARYRAFLWEMTSLSRAHRNARLRVVAWDSWRLLQSANVLDACARCHKYHLFLTSSFKPLDCRHYAGTH